MTVTKQAPTAWFGVLAVGIMASGGWSDPNWASLFGWVAVAVALNVITFRCGRREFLPATLIGVLITGLTGVIAGGPLYQTADLYRPHLLLANAFGITLAVTCGLIAWSAGRKAFTAAFAGVIAVYVGVYTATELIWDDAERIARTATARGEFDRSYAHLLRIAAQIHGLGPFALTFSLAAATWAGVLIRARHEPEVAVPA